MSLAILYQDEYLVAINKPSGLLVHRSTIDKRETVFAVQTLRNQLNRRVFPVHRLDKPTSGVLLFTLNREVANMMSHQWQDVEKHYLAATRGKVKSQHINHPITTQPDKGDRFSRPKVQAAQTHITQLAATTLPVSFGKSAANYPNTSFSLVYACLETGRKHQVRKHLKHINHPIIGDTRYGRGEINRYFRETHNIHRLMLHCLSLRFTHPVTRQTLNIYAPLDSTWHRWFIALLTPKPQQSD